MTHVAVGLQDNQSLPTSTPASSSGESLERKGKSEMTASITSAAASTASSATSDGPEHLESAHWRFEAPNLILDTNTGKARLHPVWSQVVLAMDLTFSQQWPKFEFCAGFL